MANRIAGEFSKDSAATMESLITKTLGILTGI